MKDYLHLLGPALLTIGFLMKWYEATKYRKLAEKLQDELSRKYIEDGG